MSKSRSNLNREWVDLLPQKIGVLALKMNKLKFLTSEVEVKMEAEVKIEVRFK